MRIFRIVLPLLLLFDLSAISQNVKRLSLEIKNLEDSSGYCGNVYYVTEIGYSPCFQCENGNVDVYFIPHRRVRPDHTFISFREDEFNVANINLPCLLSCNSEIRLSNFSVKVTDYSSVICDDYLKDSLWKFLPVPRVEFKLLDYFYSQDDLGYFPKKFLRAFNDDNRFLANWFSWNLREINEPIMHKRYPNDVYRFTWISNVYPYNYDPYSVRVELKKNGSAFLHCSYFCNKTKESGDIEMPISSKSLEKFLQMISGINMKDSILKDVNESHGVSYILESNIKGRYRVVFRTMGENEKLDELQRFLWELSGLGENKNLKSPSPLNVKIWTDISSGTLAQSFGEVRHFFPHDVLVEMEATRKEVTDESYRSRFYHGYGRYPTQHETDSLTTLMAKKTADVLENWYSHELLDLNEPVLCSNYPNEVYRLSWNCKTAGYVFDPYSFRIEIGDKGKAVLYCSYRKVDDCDSISVFCDVIPLTDKELLGLRNILENCGFSEKHSVFDIHKLIGEDVNLVFEANVNGQYHIVFRSEGEDEDLDKLQKFLWELSCLGENKILCKKQKLK